MDRQNPIILIVEDSDEDFYTTKRALKKSGLANNIHRCSDGEEAVNYLHRKEEYADQSVSPKPNLILLDLNLPIVDGKTILDIIKKDNNLKSIPVVILTTSDDENDVRQCYSSGANSYMQKPVDLDKFMQSIQRLKDFWFETVLLPKGSDQKLWL
ncbi:response regulator [Francisellaceae bacterium]|nr:response regulator [Francisellaceae bacterium]